MTVDCLPFPYRSIGGITRRTAGCESAAVAQVSSARGRGTLILVALSIVPGACGVNAPGPVRGETLTVIRSVPHDSDSYTQGLVVRDGVFYESSGLYGESSVREVEVETGEVLQARPLSDRYFGEGLVALGDRLYQVTWREGTGFVYEAETLDSLGTFRYTGEGWGLTTDGSHLILSDGTYRLRYLDPKTFQVTHSVDVTDDGRAIFALNELEWVRGEIWANVWQEDSIARIDPASGEVVGWMNVAGYLSWWDRVRGAEVANGIAYDAASGRLWVTGKNWPHVFEVELPAPAAGMETE